MEHKGTINIETERLILRSLKLSDAKSMIKNWVGDKEVTRYLTWEAYTDIERAKEFINKCIESNKNLDSYKWGIEYKEIGEVIGSIDVVAASERHRTVEIGYCLSKRFWNKGIMSEALNAVINYLIGTVKYNRVQACHQLENKASGQVMLKCGMLFEGIIRQGSLDNKGQLCDIATYAVLASDLN